MRETPFPSKAELRTQMRAARNAIAPAHRTMAAHRAAQAFLGNRKLASARRIAIYHTHRNELDTAPLIDSLLRAARELFLPLIVSTSTMRFVRLHHDTRLRRGRHGIAAPVTTA